MSNKVKQAAKGSSFNLWKAVKVAKNLSKDSIPSCLSLGGLNIPLGCHAQAFAGHFHSKVETNSKKVKIDENVYNGKCQLLVLNRDFMKSDDVKKCLNELSSKKCEGFDRIPVCAFNRL